MLTRVVLIFGVTFAIAGYCCAQAPPKGPDPHEEPNLPVVIPPKSPDPIQAPTKSAEKSKPLPKVSPPVPLISEEAILGSWELVPAESQFNPGPGPKSETRKYEKTYAGIVATITTETAEGKVTTVTYPWEVDGKEHPVKGSLLLDKIRLEKMDALTSEGTLMHGDKILASERREFTADGKTMKITVKDLTSDDKPVRATAVYRKK